MYLKNTLRYLIPVIGSLATIAVLFRQLNLQKMIRAAQSLEPMILILVIILSVPFVLFKAFKWQKLLNIAVPEVSYCLALRSFFFGMTASLFIPGQLGELARASCFTANRASILIFAIVDKLVDVSVLFILCCISLWTYSYVFGIAGVAFMGLIALCVWIGLRQTKCWEPICYIRTSLSAVPVHLIVFNAGLSICCYMVMALQFYMLLSEMQAIPLWVSSSVLPPILLGSAMPVFIHGLGGREKIATILLSHYSVPNEYTVFAAFLLSIVSGLLPGIVGIAFSLPILIRGRNALRSTITILLQKAQVVGRFRGKPDDCL